jgi:hypothetical protein
LSGLRADAGHVETAEQFMKVPARHGDDAEARLAEETEREAEALRAPPKPIMPSARRSMPVTAPVSRDVPSVSTGRSHSFSNTVTLSPAEREVARNSFSDPSMSPEDRERLYATNKRRMLIARANGTLNE